MPMRSSHRKVLVTFVTLAVIFFLIIPAGYGTARNSKDANSRQAASKNAWLSNLNNIDAAPGEYIVKFKAGFNETDKMQVVSEYSFKDKKDFKSINAKLISLDDNMDEAEKVTLLEQLSNDPSVEYIEPNYRLYPCESPISTDTNANKLWGLKNYEQPINGITGVSGIDINLEPAWQVTKGSSDIIVAVIDTGVNISHPDLAPNIWVNPDEIPDDGVDNDKNGYVDDVNGWDFYHNDNSVYDNIIYLNQYNQTVNEDAHGTHCSGTIAALENNAGVVGVAPQVRIMPLKFIGRDGGYTDDAIEALLYAKAKGIKIASNSWGGGDESITLYNTIAASGMLFIAAAGNGYGNNNDSRPYYPASYDLANIISVTAIDNQGNMADFSNYGSTTVDVAAPGVYIYSSIPNSSYAYMNGTSMATPHVAGIAALIASTGITDPATIKSKILASASHHPLINLSGKVLTGGLVDAAYSLTTPPVASNVVILGIKRVGKMLTGSYSYSDSDGDIEGASIFKWYSDTSSTGTSKVEISGATSSTYTLTAADLGKYIFFSITPVAASGVSPGEIVVSPSRGPVAVSLAASPLTALSISEGNSGSGKELITAFSTSTTDYDITINNTVTELTVNYTRDPASTSVKMYYNGADVSGNIITLADAAAFTIVVKETGKEDLTYTINMYIGADNCFIATAAFGSKFAPAVKLLRVFRDDYLLTNSLGRHFVKFYYDYSPPIAYYIADRSALRVLTRVLLAPFVAIVYLLYHKLLLLPCILLIGIFVYWRCKPGNRRSLSSQS